MFTSGDALHANLFADLLQHTTHLPLFLISLPVRSEDGSTIFAILPSAFLVCISSDPPAGKDAPWCKCESFRTCHGDDIALKGTF